MAKFTEATVSLKIPFTDIGIEGKWVADDNQRSAAWEMYVELVTRITVVDLQPTEGLLREALSSLYALFGITRQILKEHGPSVAQRQRDSDVSFGLLAVTILNSVLRPVLARWHPLLLDYEASQPPGTSTAEHERQWTSAAALRHDLEAIRPVLSAYARVLGEIAEVPSLIVDSPAATPTV